MAINVQDFITNQLAQRSAGIRPSVDRPRVATPNPFDDSDRMDISDRFRPQQQDSTSPDSFYGTTATGGSDSQRFYTGPINVTGMTQSVADQFVGMPKGVSVGISGTGLGTFAGIGAAISKKNLERIEAKIAAGEQGYGLAMFNGRIVGVSPGIFGDDSFVFSGVLPEGLTHKQRVELRDAIMATRTPATSDAGFEAFDPGPSDEERATAAGSNIVYDSQGNPVTVGSGRDEGNYVTTESGQYVSQDELRRQNEARIANEAAAAEAARIESERFAREQQRLANQRDRDNDNSSSSGGSGRTESAGADWSAPSGGSQKPGGYSMRAEGGRIGMADGGSADPVQKTGFVEGSPDNYTKAQTVADDENRQVRVGSFVLNAPTTEKLQKAGVLPKGVDNSGKNTTIKANKGGMMDVALSKGEYVLEPEEAKQIGYDVLNKINDQGKPEVDRRQAMGHGGMTGTKEEIEAALGPPDKDQVFDFDTIFDNMDVEFVAPERLPTSVYPYTPDIRATQDFNKDVVTISDVMAGYATSRQLGQNKNSAFYGYKRHIDNLRGIPVEYEPGKSEFDGAYKFPPLTSTQQNVLDSVESMLDFNLEQARLNKAMSAYAPSPDEDFVATAYTQTGRDRMKQFYQRGFNRLFSGQGSRPDLVDRLTQLPYIDRYATDIAAAGMFTYIDDSLEVNPDVIPSSLYDMYNFEPPTYGDTMRTVEVHELEHMGFDKSVRRNLPFINIKEAEEITSVGRNPEKYVPVEVQKAKDAAWEKYSSIPSENETEKENAFNDWLDAVDEYDAHIPDQNHSAMMVYNTDRILNATANMPLKERVLNRLNLVTTSLGYIPKGDRKKAIADRHSAMKETYPELYAFLDKEGVLDIEKKVVYISDFRYEKYIRNADELPDKVLEQLDELTARHIQYMARTYHKPISAELRAAIAAKEVDDLPEGSFLRDEADRRLSPRNLKESYETYPDYFLNNDRYTQFPLSRRVEGLAATE